MFLFFFRLSTLITRKRLWVSIAFVWSILIGYGVITVFGSSLVSLGGVQWCEIRLIGLTAHMSSLVTSVIFVDFPIAVLVILYGIVCIKLRQSIRSHNQLRAFGDNNAQQHRHGNGQANNHYGGNDSNINITSNNYNSNITINIDNSHSDNPQSQTSIIGLHAFDKNSHGKEFGYSSAGNRLSIWKVRLKLKLELEHDESGATKSCHVSETNVDANDGTRDAAPLTSANGSTSIYGTSLTVPSDNMLGLQNKSSSERWVTWNFCRCDD